MLRSFILLFFFLLNFPKLFSLENPHDPKFDWMNSLIETNFKPFAKGISLDSIEKTKKSAPSLARIKVIDNQAYNLQGLKGAAWEMVQYLIESYGLPDVDFLYYQHDGIGSKLLGGGPIFTPSKNKGVSQGLYFLDWYTHMPNTQWQKMAKTINSDCNLIWECKIPKLVWRGAPTDGMYNLENWKNYRRGKICNLGIMFPDLIDAGFSHVHAWNVQRKGEYKQFIKTCPVKGWLTIPEQVAFKYQIIIDGAFNTYPGEQWRLLSNSLVFKHKGNFGMWFHGAMIPGIHYVEIESDFSDLMQKLRYYESHDEEAKQIAQNAREFALSHLMPEHVAIYCYKALVKYASLQTFTPSLP